MNTCRLNDHANLFTTMTTFAPCDLATLVGGLRAVSALLDGLSDIVFFVKDHQARYVFANRTLALRCGLKSESELLGKTADTVFATHLGATYTHQDRQVLDSGINLEDQLELHLYFGNQPIWCMTRKIALRDASGNVIGLAGVSRDLPTSQAHHPAFDRIAAVDCHIRDNVSRTITLSELTSIAKLSVAQLERLCKQVYQLTPRQLIHKARLSEAARLLQLQDIPITEVALRCGYTDHSAFSRKFRALTSVSPSDYRARFL